ncbi:unnamed protein product [Ilex paraguariensis]|uniref:Uncharacterized protein n=1 Tax=Ilex paraguariensis TaxID=185542 RepID=A0ABC8TYM6_9AQUA
MAKGWVKSLQCKSRAVNDVVHLQPHHHHHTASKSHHLIPNSASCRKSYQNLKDVVQTTKHNKPTKDKPPQTPPTKQPSSKKPELVSNQPTHRPRTSAATRHSRASDPLFPALTELPEGHPSRNVVEIIFHTSWSPKAFSGQIEMVFKVQNLNRTEIRFEEYRQVVKSRAGSGEEEGGSEDHARCVADGNEVMRFYCLGPNNGGAYDSCSGVYTFYGRKGAAICTFSGSGPAHENAGGGRGRRAMLVCRVISGRVCKQLGFDSLLGRRVGFDSVSRANGELLVFDSRAVLPCFLILYKL